MVKGGGGGGVPTFDAESKFAKIPNSLYGGGGGGGGGPNFWCWTQIYYNSKFPLLKVFA